MPDYLLQWPTTCPAPQPSPYPLAGAVLVALGVLAICVVVWDAVALVLDTRRQP